MSALRSRNPAMGVFEQARDQRLAHDDTKVMTIGGTVTATAILLAIVTTVAMLVYTPLAKDLETAIANDTPYVSPGWLNPVLAGCFFGGLIVSFIIYSKPRIAPIIAPLHAAAEGAFVGLASFVIPMNFLSTTSSSLVIQALVATFGIAAAMLLGYATGVLRIGPMVQKIMITIGIGLILYISVLWLGRLVGFNIWNGYHDTGAMGIGFTGLCLALASLFLLLDFQYIEKGVEARAPKYMEWVGAWGLMVTLVWLYIEVLRLLAKLNSRD